MCFCGTVHYAVADYLQRAARHIASKVDVEQAYAVGKAAVELALEKLSKQNIVELDEERKAAMVSNLLVVLCGDRDAQPVVNTGTLYN